MPARGSPAASSCCSGCVASQSSSAETSRPSKSLESTSTVPPDSPKPRESHVSTLKPARRSGPRPTWPTGASVALFSSLSRVGAPAVRLEDRRRLLARREALGREEAGADRRAVEGRDDRRRGRRPRARPRARRRRRPLPGSRRTRAFIGGSMAVPGPNAPVLVHFASGKQHRGASPPALAAGHIDDLDARELAHPGQLAAGEVARAALHRLDVAGQQLVEAQRLARGLRGPAAWAARTSRAAPAATIASTRASMRA